MTRRWVVGTTPEQRRHQRQAAEAADARFQAAHPERNGSPIGPGDNARIREEWMEYFEEAGGAVFDDENLTGDVTDPVLRCQNAWISFVVVDDETGKRVPGVAMIVKLPGQVEADVHVTDEDGFIRFPDLGVMGQAGVAGPPASYLSIPGVGGPVGWTVSRIGDVVGYSAHPDDQTIMPGSPPDPYRPQGIYSIGIIDEVRVGQSNSRDLADIALWRGIEVAPLCRFNFGRSHMEHGFKYAVENYTGCRSFDRHRMPLFSPNDDPGIVYAPRNWAQAGFAHDTVHELRVRFVAREHDVEIQTVDEVNITRSRQSVRLWPGSGDPLDITTDERGFARVEDLRFSGLLAVTDLQNNPLRPARMTESPDASESDEDGAYRFQATIDPLLVHATVTSICVPRLDEDGRRQYERVAERYRGLSQVTDDRILSRRPRFFNNAVDNAFIAAGWDDVNEQVDLTGLTGFLTDLVRDRHGVLATHGFVLGVITGTRMLLVNAGSVEETLHFNDGMEVRGKFGAYGLFERNGQAVFVDLRGQIIGDSGPRTLVIFRNGDRVEYRDEEGRAIPGPTPLSLLLSPSGESRLESFLERHDPKRFLIYRAPNTAGEWTLAARNGGLGRLEEYPPPADPIFNRVQDRNLHVLRGVVLAYNGYIESYSRAVDQIGRDRDELPTEPTGMSAFIANAPKDTTGATRPNGVVEDDDGVNFAADNGARSRQTDWSRAPFAIRCEWALKQLGPPEAVWEYPLPFGLEDMSVSRIRDARLALARIMIGDAISTGASSFPAWRAISVMLARIYNERPPGSMQMQVSFEPTGELSVARGINYTGGLGISPGVRSQTSFQERGFMRMKVKGNIDWNEVTGDIDPAADWPIADIGNPRIEIGVENSLVLGASVGAPLGFRAGGNLHAEDSRFVEIDLVTRDYRHWSRFRMGIRSGWEPSFRRNMVAASMMGHRRIRDFFNTSATDQLMDRLAGAGNPEGQRVRNALRTRRWLPDLAIETSDTGDVRFDIVPHRLIGRMTFEGNRRRGAMAFLKCFQAPGPGAGFSIFIDRVDLQTGGELCVGLSFQLLSEETILAVVAQAPGFFQTVDLHVLGHRQTTWNHLTSEMREGFLALGWSMHLWDRKHEADFPEHLWPQSVRRRWIDLSSFERFIAARLGFRESGRNGWWAFWRSVGAPYARPSTEEIDAATEIARDSAMGEAAELIGDRTGLSAHIPDPSDYFGGRTGFIQKDLDRPPGN